MADPLDAHPDDIAPDASAPDHREPTGTQTTPDAGMSGGAAGPDAGTSGSAAGPDAGTSGGAAELAASGVGGLVPGMSTVDSPVAVDAADRTSVLPVAPESPAWSGRAGVPERATEYLRGSTPYQQPAAPPVQRTWWTPLLLGLVALGLVGIVVLAAWLIGRSNDPDPTPTPVIVATNATKMPVQTSGPVLATPSAEPSPSAQLVEIPMHLVGMTQEEATEALQSLGLGYRFEFRQSQQPEGVVIASRPDPGQVIAINTTVTLVISLGPGATATATPAPTATG